MAQINLLPWREELKKQQQKDFLSAIGAAVLTAGALLLFLHMHISGLISNQQERNQYLKTEIAILDKKIAEIKTLETLKSNLLARMDVIQSLQGSRPEIVHLFDEIAKTVPEGIYIDKLVQSGGNLTLNGIALSNARVSAYMRRLESSPWLKSPGLTIIETKDKTNANRASNFILKVQQVAKNNSVEAGG